MKSSVLFNLILLRQTLAANLLLGGAPTCSNHWGTFYVSYVNDGDISCGGSGTNFFHANFGADNTIKQWGSV